MTFIHVQFVNCVLKLNVVKIRIVLNKRGDMMAKGKPKKDGSGRGTGANAGRGGCKNPKKTRKGKNKELIG